MDGVKSDSVTVGNLAGSGCAVRAAPPLAHHQAKVVEVVRRGDTVSVVWKFVRACLFRYLQVKK